ncbi:MAG: hypothetical protein CMI54_07415 [Parcubacteria group bacterium]|jgi:hypothetical protein|nr:hypothetical protein [Parcubacteria group bacterium]
MATDILTASEKVDVFNRAIKPLETHKKQFQSGKFEGTGMKDEDIFAFTDEGIPVTEAQQKGMAGRKFLKKAIVDPALLAPRKLWNVFTPEAWHKGFGEPFGIKTKYDQVAGRRVDVEERKSELEQAKLYRATQGRVRDDILMLAETARNRFIETGDTKYLDAVVQAKNDIFAAQNITDDNFVTIGNEVWGLRDEMGLFTNSPNPYPVIEGLEKFGLGWYGMVKGDKLVNKHFVEKFLKGAAKGGRQSKGPWLARTVGTVLGGASAVAVADFGNEVMLDIMNRAGQAKKWMADDSIRVGMWDAILAENVPEALTFGGEGINRPGWDERKKEAFEAFAWDAAITSTFFGARPLYYGLRQGIGAWPFKMFKPRPTKDPSVVGNLELLEAEQALITKYHNPKVLKEMGLKSIGEPLVFNAPFGKFLWKVVNSNAPFNPFRWMGPQGAIKKGSDEWWPEPLELMGTQLGRHMVGGQIGPGMAATMSPAPLFGSGIRDNMATRGDYYLKVIGQEMLGKFAPYANAGDQALDWTVLASRNARGFKAAAKDLERIFDESAKGAGKIFNDETMVTVGKQVLKEFRDKLQIDAAGKEIPPETISTAIKFIENQIIKPVGEAGPLKTNTMRSLAQMKGIREGMDDLLKPLKDETLAQTAYADSITRLFKAWEIDMGSVGTMGYPEVAKAWQNYDNFVSKGMLLWMTDVGKAVNKIQTRGFDIVLQKDPTRAGEQLFDVVIKAAQAHPERAGSELAALKRIVGPRAYHNGVGSYIRKTFSDSIGEKSGMLHFDAAGFKKKMGIGSEGSALKTLMEDALPGPKVAKLRIFDPTTGLWKEFDDELYAEGIKKGLTGILRENVPAEFLKAENRILPTTKEFEHLANILERLFVNGVPDPSKFMMRRAIMSGTRNSLRALLPTHALGMSRPGSPTGKQFGAGTAGAAIGMGPLTAAGMAYLINYGGRVLTNPVSMRVWMNMMDANLPETIRVANWARLVRMYPEEFMEFDKDLAELEQAQRKFNKVQQVDQERKSTGAKIKEAIGNTPGNIRKGLDRYDKVNEFVNPNYFNLTTPDEPEEIKPGMEGSMYAPYADEYDSSKVGSSITGSSVMNPAAAASLYTGNTDAALANQFGGGATQYAADGGIMNAVMDNKGKFTPIQKGINDNPFNQSKNSGITGVL